MTLRFLRERALLAKRDLSSALDDFRLCGAAVRLHMNDDQIAGPGPVEFMIKKVEGVVTFIVRVAVMIKVQNKADRPFFTTEELNDLEKELGIGLFSKDRYKCGNCGKSRKDVKLFDYPKCKRQWFCSQECFAAKWKAHKKNACVNSWRSCPGVVRCQDM